MESIFLLELMVILILSLLVLFVCNYLKIPLIIGYIISGILAGPFVLGVVGSTQIIEHGPGDSYEYPCEWQDW